MTIEERVKLAEEKHHSGYNCAQAVISLELTRKLYSVCPKDSAQEWQICREPVEQ